MVTLSEPIPLTQLRRGARATVHVSHLDGDDASTLRAMGIRPSATVTVQRNGRTCIVDVCDSCGTGCRIGMCRRLAQRVLVHPHA